MNPMQQVRIEKVTLNVGAGKDQKVLEKGVKLLQNITEIPPVQTVAKKRIPNWGLRPGLPIGCKITLRNKKAEEMLKRLIEAKDLLLDEKQFDENGSIAFGIPEYIDVPGVSYDPEIGVMGFEVCVTLERAGYRLKKRRLQKKRVSPRHRVSRQDAIAFMQQKFQVKLGDTE
jgi:large subunit ribosomal protein L5